jgi:hypothetical protein
MKMSVYPDRPLEGHELAPFHQKIFLPQLQNQQPINQGVK